ncbi:hypothetical protein GCM10007897_41750 [Sphingobium jiangsuense]|uniref:Uncharacterized protein n=1 Tax=Sphingobium jiangsuense TaxID=870476 RepID=A0A7W6FQL2_9SPHN|nr:hypothetical protein [Sphingobium jiangsuense]MBB3926129.1 hypothetical protein [Sphingobium jiangsuense]GLT02752.1 hypothetical protein GCM10007897_41750 [Sphingobium jiangsuense]
MTVTSDQMVDLLLARLVKERGGGKFRWRRVVGPVRLYSLATHPHCNWAITPAGTSAEVEAVERLADDLRLSHPILSGR